MNKTELLKQIKENLRNSSIVLPRGLDLCELNHTINISMQNGIIKNMQADSANVTNSHPYVSHPGEQGCEFLCGQYSRA